MLSIFVLLMITIAVQGKLTISENEKSTSNSNVLDETANHHDTNKRLVFIDTDGGSDDLLALMQLIRDPDTIIIGIACTYGNVDLGQACTNVLRTLHMLNRTDIPVYPGCDSPLTALPVFDQWFGPDGMGNSSSLYPLPTDKTMQPKHAVSAMMEMVTEYPGQVTMLSLGSLTNLAVVLKLDSFYSFKLKDHILMGGAMKAVGNLQPASEFNFYEDPEAAVTVFSKAAFPITVVPFELCLSSGPTWDVYEGWMETKNEETIFMDRLFKLTNEKMQPVNGSRFSPCDLLTSTVLIASHQVVTESALRTARVEQCGMVTRGELVVDYRKTSKPEVANVHLITEINSEAVVKIWEKLLMG